MIEVVYKDGVWLVYYYGNVVYSTVHEFRARRVAASLG